MLWSKNNGNRSSRYFFRYEGREARLLLSSFTFSLSPGFRALRQQQRETLLHFSSCRFLKNCCRVSGGSPACAAC